MAFNMTFKTEGDYTVCYINGKEVSRTKKADTGASEQDVVDIINDQIKANPEMAGTEPNLEGLEVSGDKYTVPQDSVYVVKSTDITNFIPTPQGNMQVTLSQELEDVILGLKKLVYIDWENQFPALYDNITKISLFTPVKFANIDGTNIYTFSCVDGTGDITIGFFKINDDWYFAKAANQLLTQEAFDISLTDKVIPNPTLDGTEADLTGLEILGTRYKVGGGATLDDIVDANGNKRFVEGELTDGSSGATLIYKKWSLSGTHLMIVLAGIVTSNLADSQALATVTFPTYINSKIKTLGTSAQLVTVAKGYFIKNSEYTATEYTFNLRYVINEFRIIPTQTITISGTYNFRIQFDLLIDAS